MSCTQPSDKHQRAQIITCGSQRSRKSERRWGLSLPPPAPEFPTAASVLDSVGLREAWTSWPNIGTVWPGNLVSANFTGIIKKSWAGSVNPAQTFKNCKWVEFVWMEKAGRLISELRSYLQVPLNSMTCSRSQSKRAKLVVYSHRFVRLPEPACSHPTALLPWGKDHHAALTQEPEGEKAILGLFTQKPLGIFWVILTFPFTHPLKPEHHASLFCPLGLWLKGNASF